LLRHSEGVAKGEEVEERMWWEEVASKFEELGSEIVHQEGGDDLEVVGDGMPEE
jgi:hypothetical protein